MKSFSIGIISDIHFGELAATQELCVPGVRLSHSIDGAASYIESCIDVFKDRRIKYLFISGDLTSFANPEEFVYCENVIVRIAKGCNVPFNHIVYCLGNHDVDWTISELYKKEASEDILRIRKQAYQKVALYAPSYYFRELPRLDNQGPNSFSGVLENEDMIVFVLNTNTDISREQSEERYSHGVIGQEQLKWLKTITQEYVHSDKTKILLMHHHPFNYPYPLRSEDISTMMEGPEIMEIAGQSGVDYIIHGHRHHPFAHVFKTNDFLKPISIVCAGSFGINSKERLSGNIPNMMHVLEIEDGIGHLYNYIYNVRKGWIKPANSDDIDIDPEVYLGKTVEESVIRDKLKNYIVSVLEKDSFVQLKRETPIEDLKFMSDKKANEICLEISNEMQLTVFGKFPENVMLIKEK